MAGNIMRNHYAATITANQLVIRAGQMLTPANGKPLTAEVEHENFIAATLVEYANQIRADLGLDPLEATPSRELGPVERTHLS